MLKKIFDNKIITEIVIEPGRPIASTSIHDIDIIIKFGINPKLI